MGNKVSFIFGIIALFIPILWLLVYISYGYYAAGFTWNLFLLLTIIMSFLAIIFGIVGIVKKGDSTYLSIIGLVFGFMAFIVFFIVFSVVF